MYSLSNIISNIVFLYFPLDVMLIAKMFRSLSFQDNECYERAYSSAYKPSGCSNMTFL